MIRLVNFSAHTILNGQGMGSDPNLANALVGLGPYGSLSLVCLMACGRDKARREFRSIIDKWAGYGSDPN